MNKYIYAILFLLLSISPAKAQAPWDLIYHALPVSITFDIPEEISQISGNVQSAASQAKKMIMAVKKDMTNLQTAMMTTFNNIKSGAILDIVGNPGQKKSGFCGQDLSKVSTKKIVKKVKEVFFSAKSYDLEYQGEFKKQREKFYMDSLYTIFAASLIMQKEVEEDIKAQIDKAISCANGNGSECGIPSSDEGGNNEVIFTYGKTLEALDSVVRMWESVAALKARLAAIKIIYTSPYNYEVEEEDADPESQAFLNNSQSTIIYQNITPISFAQLDLSKVEKNDNLSAQLTKSRAEKTNSLKQAKNAVSEASAKNLSEGFDGSRVSFASPTMNEKEHPLAAMQDEMESLSEMNEVESLVSEAMDTHNLITDLPQYKQQAESYMQAIEYHKRSLEKLKVSEKCAIKYLGKYFKDPHLVWSGKLPIEDATNHDLRKGVSGWAYNAFELLKSGEATETIEAFSIAKEEMNKEKTTDEEDEKAYLHDQEALNKKIENMKSQQRSQEEGVVKDYITAEELLKISDDPQKGLDMGELDENGEFIRDENGKVDLSKTRFGGPNAEALVNESMSASKKGTVTEETRKASMLSWQIGAEASEMLGNPDYKWGSEYTDKKLIWNDTKRFYRKYLELKYNNILGYIKSVSSMDIMEIIAGKLVGKKVSISNTEYQKQRRAQVDAIVKEIKNGLATEREAALANIADGFKSELSKADKEACPDIDIEEYKVCLEAKKTKFTNIAKKVCSKDFAKGIEEKNYRDDPKKTNKDNTEIKKDFNSKIAHQSLACLEVAQELAKVNADIIHQNILEAKDEIIATKAAKEDEVIDAQLAAATAPVVFTDDETKISTTKITGLVKDKLSENIASNTASKISSDVEIKVKEEGIEAKKVEIAAETSYSTMLERAIKKKKLELQEKAAPVDADEKASAEEQSDSRISALEASLGAVNEKSKAFDEIRNYIITATKDNPVEGLKDPASINAAIFSMHADIKGLMGKLQDKAYEVIITNGYNEMLKLGDDLYSEANHGKLVKMHTDIIKKLKSTKLTFTITNTALKGLIGSSDLNILDELLSSIDFIGSVNLSKDMIEAEQEGFFVGATPSERDLKAPMRLTGFDQPPVREIFHFDAEDFKHVKEEEQAAEEAAENDDDTKPDWIEKVLGFAQEAAEKISKQKRSIDKQFFLDYGGKIPKIWQVMLSDYPFVETRYSLKEALDDYENGKSSGDDKCARTTFSRGGIMPCLYGYNEKNKQYDYVLDITQNSKYIHYKADATHNKNLGACAGIKAKLNPAGTPPGIEPYHEFWKVFLNNGTGGADALASCEPSELGMLLEADKHNNLFLRKTVYKNFNRINKQNASENKKPIEKMSKVKRRNLVAAQQSEFSRNQVGDFLKQAESEKMLKENLEEVKAGYEKSMEVLTAIFIENGFTPSKDFNLANKEDYKLAEKNIKNVKKQRLEKAKEALAKINVKENEQLKEKSQNMKKLINFMYTDIDSLLTLSMADADSNDLAIRLLKATADQLLIKKHKEANSLDDDGYVDVEEPFCAIY